MFLDLFTSYNIKNSSSDKRLSFNAKSNPSLAFLNYIFFWISINELMLRCAVLFYRCLVTFTFLATAVWRQTSGRCSRSIRSCCLKSLLSKRATKCPQLTSRLTTNKTKQSVKHAERSFVARTQPIWKDIYRRATRTFSQM